MITMTQREHATALFVIALYHWWIGDHLNARSALRVAVKVATMPAHGDA
jgi:hypothetical protein